MRSYYGYELMADGGVNKDYLNSMLELRMSDIVSSATVEMYHYYQSKGYIPPSDRTIHVTSNDVIETIFGAIL